MTSHVTFQLLLRLFVSLRRVIPDPMSCEVTTVPFMPLNFSLVNSSVGMKVACKVYTSVEHAQTK
jgi:hypothetical protein